MTQWTDKAIDAATRVFCCGLPLTNDNRAKSLVGQIAQGRCLGPDCDCWAPGREVARAALNAASNEN